MGKSISSRIIHCLKVQALILYKIEFRTNLLSLKGIIRPIIRKALKMTSAAICFRFLILILNFVLEFKVLSRLSKHPSNPPTSLANELYELYGHKPQSFPPNHAPKMRESQQLFFGGWLMSRIFEDSNILQFKPNIAKLWRIFSSNKSTPANRKKGFYIQTVC
jgi:hypothetical protein